jgi:hypothetical protein
MWEAGVFDELDLGFKVLEVSCSLMQTLSPLPFVYGLSTATNTLPASIGERLGASLVAVVSFSRIMTI